MHICAYIYDFYVSHFLRCLPIWRKSFVMSGLSCLGTSGTSGGAALELRLNNARHEFLKHAMLEWCELEAPWEENGENCRI